MKTEKVSKKYGKGETRNAMLLSMPDFTKPELDYIRSLANFTEREERLFDLRSKDVPHETCAEILNVSLSTEKRINKKMIAKILKLL